MSTYDNEQEIMCDDCRRYLFTEKIDAKTGRWQFVGKPACEYRFYEDGKFLCLDCLNARLKALEKEYAANY